MKMCKECQQCGSRFEPNRSDQKYCSRRCRQAAYQQRKELEGHDRDHEENDYPEEPETWEEERDDLEGIEDDRKPGDDDDREDWEEDDDEPGADDDPEAWEEDEPDGLDDPDDEELAATGEALEGMDLAEREREILEGFPGLTIIQDMTPDERATAEVDVRLIFWITALIRLAVTPPTTADHIQELLDHVTDFTDNHQHYANLSPEYEHYDFVEGFPDRLQAILDQMEEQEIDETFLFFSENAREDMLRVMGAIMQPES